MSRWTISISNQENGNKIVSIETDNIISEVRNIISENNGSSEYEIREKENLVEYYGLTKEGANLIIVAQSIIEEIERKEENMLYTTIKEDFGSMPLAGYFNKIINTVAHCDGLDVVAFLKNLDSAANEIRKQSESNNNSEEEVFIVLGFDEDQNSSLEHQICYDLDSYEEMEDYEPKFYRLYTRNEDWGFDEIEFTKEEKYTVVKVKISRVREVKEYKELVFAVAKSFSDNPEDEAESYITNSYCDSDDDWEIDDDFYNSYNWEPEVEDSDIMSENISHDDAERRFEIEDYLE